MPADTLTGNHETASSPPCPSCDVLSRHYRLVCEQNAALAARNRALEAAIARLVVSGEQVRAGLAEYQKASGA